MKKCLFFFALTIGCFVTTATPTYAAIIPGVPGCLKLDKLDISYQEDAKSPKTTLSLSELPLTTCVKE
jgi:hypothetical protein